MRQEDSKFDACLSYIESPCLKIQDGDAEEEEGQKEAEGEEEKKEETAYGKVNTERASLEVSAVPGMKSFPTTDFGLPILTLENLCITQEII